jgi:hypothetical protein
MPFRARCTEGATSMAKNKYPHIDAMNSEQLRAYIDSDDITHDEHVHAVKVMKRRKDA